MVQAVISSRGDDNGNRPPLQGSRMRIEGGARRAQLANQTSKQVSINAGGGRFAGGAENMVPNGGGAAGYQLDSSSMFHHAQDMAKTDNKPDGHTNLKMR